MAGIWIYSEDTIVAQQLMTMARPLADKLGQPLCVVTIAEQAAPEFVAAGANKVFVLKNDSDWPESYAPALVALAEQETPTAFFIGATFRGKDLAAKIAARLKTGLVTDAFAVRFENGEIETDRAMYGGLAVCTEILKGIAVVTIPPRTFDMPAKDSGRSGEIVTIDASIDATMAVENVCPIVRQGADITKTEKLVCVGRGLAKQVDMKLAEDLAGALGAELGCTRSIAEDYHWLPNETYIGLSGQKIKPVLYLSMGVSGQVQHIAGIRDSKVIVAIDSNENAPIFAAADYGIVGDLYEIVPLLIEAIKNQK
ncbi:electron transfer flavoprotein subunit alpha/FixB family protein [Sporomusa acidovorans]|uniref:Protein FixB n=1 Tax=Sporomusa acidovorans (strain ATCC 49682 / DSM 3132 / Mol) TaxID=1123286 RepID=A0ABZ3J8W3_SPOA4|nr:electron transfer flavoprotein subunit alpha/FixB family protein [Sporomusa acidovorans]OZC16110.1 acryloyl-CoA reductase electron transfer subunit beta [Sporomusa acidovorans DSM 3132]SDD86473.1 electron transfer flavoprotein alpha subunit apoprotein [Sporomusa acidovorans]